MLWIFVGLFSVYLLITYVMFVVICKKVKNNKPLSVIHNAIEDALKPYEEKVKKGHSWVEEKRNEGRVEDIFILSEDGLKLHGILIKQENPKGVMVECHGYRSTAKGDLYPSCFEYYGWGYDLLLIDQRTTGGSEGDYITFGVKESKDVGKWCEYVSNHYEKKPIILAGISMGATTVLLATEYLRKEWLVKAIIADSGFISAWNEVVYAIGHYFHLPGICFVGMIDCWCRLFAKFSLREKNTTMVLGKEMVPILFIHGKEDDFVLKSNTEVNYMKYQGQKELLLVDKASHGMSYMVDTSNYVKTVKDFIQKYGM